MSLYFFYLCVELKYVMMKINKLTIENYKCFKQFEIEFAPGATVLIGKNGAGKSSLIHAIHKAMSFIFANFNETGYVAIAAANPDLKVASLPLAEIWRSYEGQAANEVKLQGDATYHDVDLRWIMNKASTSRAALRTTLYKQAHRTFSEEYMNSGELPLLAYFSDSYPHLHTSLTRFAEEQLKNIDGALRNFGYYQWDDEKSCFNIWEKKFVQTTKDAAKASMSIQNVLANEESEELVLLHQAAEEMGWDFSATRLTIPRSVLTERRDIIDRWREGLPLFNKIWDFNLQNAELEFIKKCLIEFSKSTQEEKDPYEIAFVETTSFHNEEEILLTFANRSTKKSTFINLPAGFRRLFSMVLDIAYRYLILNCLNRPIELLSLSTDQVKGVVVIDEIDLHLHPSLQQDVLLRLRKVFPNVQFIVTTHSPLVIMNVPTHEGENTILKLLPDESTPSQLNDIYGIDYNTGLHDVMDTPSSNVIIDDIKQSISRALRFQDHKLAKMYKDELVQHIGQEKADEYMNGLS